MNWSENSYGKTEADFESIYLKEWLIILMLIEKSDKNPDEYNNHVMRGCGEVDGKPNCNGDCQHCVRKHCPYRKK